MDTSVRTSVLLSFLVCLQTVCAEFPALTPIQLAPIPCNDKVVEKLSRLAITYVNEDRTDGYKFALNRVANVHLHAQGPAGNVYYLDLDVLETKCHTGSPKPWKRCEVRAFMETQISGNCNTTILHTSEGYSYLYSYDCTLIPDPPEKLQQTCPTCPVLLTVDSPQAVTAARVTLDAYKQRSALGAGLGVKKITRAAVQTLPVKVNSVEYTVQYCPEGVTVQGTCQWQTLESDTETAGFCSGSVHGNLNAHPEVHVTCEMFKLQNVDVLRPVLPQGHNLPFEPTYPPLPPVIIDPENEPEPLLPDPTLPPVEPPVPFNPASTPMLPSEPSVVVTRSIFSDSSSSESSEILTKRQSFDSSSEEIGGLVARRPPISFHYQRRERRRRQALMESQPSHNPIFLSDFPSGSSPFRSCPGPARYTTV